MLNKSDNEKQHHTKTAQTLWEKFTNKYNNNNNIESNLKLFLDKNLLDKGTLVFILEKALTSDGWKEFYPYLTAVSTKLNTSTKNSTIYFLISTLKLLHDLAHLDNKIKSSNREITVQKYIYNKNSYADVKNQLQEHAQKYIKDKITLVKMYQGNETEEKINQQSRSYQQETATSQHDKTWIDTPENQKHKIFGLTDPQKIWLKQHTQIHNFLHAGNTAKLNIIKHAITTGFLKQGTVNHILTQITAKNINYETFYGEHLNKLYTHLLKNGMDDVGACKVIVAFKHIFDIYHNEKYQNNDAIQTARQHHFPDLDTNDSDEFKKQIEDFIQKEIANNNSEQVKKDQDDYAKNYKNFSSNPRWQHYAPENKHFTEEQKTKLWAQTTYLEDLPESSRRLLAIAIANKYNKLAGHSSINASYDELAVSDQTKVNSLMNFLSSGIPLRNGKPNLEALNHAIMHAPSRGSSTNYEDFRDVCNIDPKHFNIELFRKIRFETDTKNAEDFEKDAEIIEKALLPQKIQQNIQQLITDFINQIQMSSAQEVPQVLSMLQAIIKSSAGHAVNTSDSNNISTVHANILDYMKNFKPDNLTQKEFNDAIINAIRTYIDEYLSNSSQYQLFFNKQQERQEEVKRNRISKNYLKLAQSLVNKTSNELADAGHFTPKQHEQNLKDLIQDGSIISYTSYKKTNPIAKVTDHKYQIVFPDFDDANNPIVIESSTTTGKNYISHITATMPNLDANSDRTSFLLLSYFRTLKKTGLEKVNISNLDSGLQAKVAVCCKLLKLETDIKPKNMRLYRKFLHKLSSNPTRNQSQTSGHEQKMPQNMQDLQNMMQQQSGLRRPMGPVN